MINLELIPLRPGFPVGVQTTLFVLLRVSADPAALPPAGPRPNLNIAVVIDRSGSMSGRPLEEAKRCAKAIVDRLGDRDRMSVVAYDNNAEVIYPSMPVRDREAVRSSIDRIITGGSTALHDGWHLGATQVARHFRAEDVSQVLLLSDGVANHGLTDTDRISGHSADLAASGITTSTYGLGLNFNEDLMTRMAQDGQGQAHYGQTAEDLMEPFQTEFDLLSALAARRLRLSLSTSPGMAELTEVTMSWDRAFDHPSGKLFVQLSATSFEARALHGTGIGVEPTVIAFELTIDRISGEGHYDLSDGTITDIIYRERARAFR